MKALWLVLFFAAIAGIALFHAKQHIAFPPSHRLPDTPIIMSFQSSSPEVQSTQSEQAEQREHKEVKEPLALSSYAAAAGAPRAQSAATRVKPILSPELAAKGLHWGDPVFLRAFKEEGELELFVQDRASKRFVLFRTYKIAKQSGQLGPKEREGDGQVPEGFYYAGRSAMKPDSTYHLAINCGYPNSYDRAHERTGSFIMIHGNTVSIGCLAMTDEKIEEIYSLCDAALAGGQDFFRIHLFPFRMTETRLVQAADHRWLEFWKNLKDGYDHFETHGIPPEVGVKNLRYEFSLDNSPKDAP